MEDRQVDLDGIPEQFIKENGYEFLLDDEYIVPEGIVLKPSEIDAAINAQNEIYAIFKEELTAMVKADDFAFLNLPDKMIELIKYSFNEKDMHILGRFDFAGGVEDLPLKLLEYNADTPTMLPESSVIQDAFTKHYSEPYQLNSLRRHLEVAFNRLSISSRDRHPSLLATSLGHEEDVANAELVMQIAAEEGFEVAYADLPDIDFSTDEGIFVEAENGESAQYDYLYKLIPWEFICFDEPELLDILHNLILSGRVYVMNPAYTLVYQSKVFLDHVSRKYDLPYFLDSSRDPSDFRGKKYVEKVSFGRLGENIKIYDEQGNVIEENDGDFGHFEKVYQEFADLYKDSYGEYYQLGMYNVNGVASAISFRRGEKLILDDDCQFIPHFESTKL